MYYVGSSSVDPDFNSENRPVVNGSDEGQQFQSRMGAGNGDGRLIVTDQ